ncbi:MAG TPA: polysaccharide pyruvyl transferase family protein [Patescibacteria group bacterium]|nr:polysaccharide pyruvyl transferase family protein [Patescibacteria group bacterium]
MKKIINIKYIQRVSSFCLSIVKNKLLFNSLSLMVASGVTAGFGFIFWTIIARSYSTQSVGFATTLLSVATILSLIGLAGFDTIFLRFLSKTEDKNIQINNGVIVTGIVSFIVSSIFLIFLPILSPTLQIIFQGNWYPLLFVLFTIFMSWNILTNSILISHHHTSLILLIELLSGIFKLILAMFFNTSGTITIFSIVGLSQIFNVVLSVFLIIRVLHYKPSLQFDIQSLKKNYRFGLVAYISQLLNLLPASLLPLIVVNTLGATSAAYYYVSFSIANLLYTIAYTTNQVLLAESSGSEELFLSIATRGIKIITGIMTPVIALVVLFCPALLLLFGGNYSREASTLLRIMCLAGFIVAIYSFLGFIFKHTKNLKALLFMSATYVVSILSLSYFLISVYGLIGVGFAWFLGTLISIFIGIIFMVLRINIVRQPAASPKNILITHFYSKNNNGDAALLSVLINDLKRKFGNPAISIVASDVVKQNERFDGINVYSSFMFYAMNRFKSRHLTFLYSVYVMMVTFLWAVVYRYTKFSIPIPKGIQRLCLYYSKADLIIPVGGGYLRGQNKGIGSLLYICLILHPLIIGNVLRKPNVLYTQSVGPFSNRFESYLVSKVLNSFSQAVIVRENISHNILRGRVKKLYRSVDSGFAFEGKGNFYNLDKVLNQKRYQFIIGVTAKKYFKSELQEKYELALARTIEYIFTKYRAAVILIPQVTAEYNGDDDRIVHNRIFSYIRNKKDVYVINDKLNHYDIKTIYGQLDLVIGTRFHSVIFSLTSYVPAIAIEYEHKTRGIMKDLGLSKWVIKIEDVNLAKLSSMVDKLVEERVIYREKLIKVIPTYRSRAKNAIAIVDKQYKEYITSSKHVNREGVFKRPFRRFKLIFNNFSFSS